MVCAGNTEQQKQNKCWLWQKHPERFECHIPYPSIRKFHFNLKSNMVLICPYWLLEVTNESKPVPPIKWGTFVYITFL